MSAVERIDADLKTSMKASDTLKVSVLRMAKAAIKNRLIEKRAPELSEEETYALLRGLVKQRRDSIEQFTKAGRTDLAEKESREIDIINDYLPPAMDVEEVERLVREAIEETGAKGEKEMGKVMKALMPKLRGAADGKIVNEKVREILRAGENG